MNEFRVRIVKDDNDNIYINKEDMLLFFYRQKDFYERSRDVVLLLYDFIEKFDSLR